MNIISIQEFISHLPFECEIIASELSMKNLSQDIALLSEGKVWLHPSPPDEFKAVFVCVHTNVFPAYSSTFDLLLRFLQQAGAAGILFQGGKRTDFPKSTMILAERLGMPLVLLDSSVKFSVLTRCFYKVLTERMQQTKVQLQEVRRRLEAAQQSSSSLSVWMNMVERELSVKVKLRTVENAHGDLKARWNTSSSPDLRRRLLISVRGLQMLYQLELCPTEYCPFAESDAEETWIQELAGTLSLQASYFLLAELPGAVYQNRWATSMECLLYYHLSRLSLFRPVFHGATMQSAATSYSVDQDRNVSEASDGLSVERRMSLIQVKPVGTMSLLWIKNAVDDVKISSQAVTGDFPNAYHAYAPHVLLIRQQILILCGQARYSAGTQQGMLSCTPWRDWKGNEGVLVFWFSFAGNELNLSEESVKELAVQLEARLQFPIRAYFSRQLVDRETDVEKIVAKAVMMTKSSYEPFLHSSTQSKTTQFAGNEADVASLMISNPTDSSIHHVVRLLGPLLEEPNKPLLEALEAYLECGGKMQMAAEKLYLHRNTLRYRLKRAEELTRVSLDDDEVRFAFRLAIRTWRMHH